MAKEGKEWESVLKMARGLLWLAHPESKSRSQRSNEQLMPCSTLQAMIRTREAVASAGLRMAVIGSNLITH